MAFNLHKFARNRRGQVRGIDFALAMLIFIIAFSQIIIVLSNLLIPSLVQMETYSQEQDLDTLYSNIFYSQGYPTNWGSRGISYLSDFRVGLLGNQESLDFTKINRLTSGIMDFWQIDYIKTKTSFALIQDFALEIYSPITISLNSVQIAFDKITINGMVTEYQTPIKDADVWVFSIDANNNVALNYTQTKDISGVVSFKSVINVNTTGYYSIVAFAQVGGIYQDYTVLRMEKEASGLEYFQSEFVLNPFVRENTASKTSAVDISVARTQLSDEAQAFVLFPYGDIDITHRTTSLAQVNNNEGQIYLAENIPAPADGVAVVVVQEREGTEYRAGFIGIPMFLTENLGGTYGPISQMPESSYISVTHILMVRNVLVKCQMWYW
ncbi:MAG: hypothetical protein HGN29_03995 [Asgard group archaeon]|nr:hypothetical protein [Asgard group archaeon]